MPTLIDQQTDAKSTAQAEPVSNAPTVEQCAYVREKTFQQLGNIDAKMLVSQEAPISCLYIIHRTHSGNVAIVTSNLSDPSGDSKDTTGFGLELLAEAKEVEVGTGSVLGKSYLYQMMHEVAGNFRLIGLKLRKLIDEHGLVFMELNNVVAPPEFTDPATNRTGVIIGVPSKDIPDHFMMPGDLKVRIVTVRLLTFQEIQHIRNFDAAGRKHLAELFAQDGTHHVSSISPPKPWMLSQLTKIEIEKTSLRPAGYDNIIWNPVNTLVKLCKLQNLELPPPATLVFPAPAAAATSLPNFLPYLDANKIRVELEMKTPIKQFSKPTVVANAMARFKMRVQEIVEDAKHPANGFAKHVKETWDTHTQLPGWKHVQDYIIDKGEKQTRVIDALSATGDNLLKRLGSRLDWVLGLEAPFDPDFFLQVLALDKGWMDETSAFMRGAELQVTEMLQRHPKAFAAFRDRQKRGVHWPLSPELRKSIESAGFTFKPMMIKRDRCVCETCGSEVSGWRPWFNPWHLHDLTKHSQDFLEKAKRFGVDFPQSGRYSFKSTIVEKPVADVPKPQSNLPLTIKVNNTSEKEQEIKVVPEPEVVTPEQKVPVAVPVPVIAFVPAPAPVVYIPVPAPVGPVRVHGAPPGISDLEGVELSTMTSVVRSVAPPPSYSGHPNGHIKVEVKAEPKAGPKAEPKTEPPKADEKIVVQQLQSASPPAVEEKAAPVNNWNFLAGDTWLQLIIEKLHLDRKALMLSMKGFNDKRSDEYVTQSKCLDAINAAITKLLRPDIDNLRRINILSTLCPELYMIAKAGLGFFAFFRSVPNDANYKTVEEWFKSSKDHIEKNYNYRVKIDSDGKIKLKPKKPEPPKNSEAQKSQVNLRKQ